MPEKVPDLDAQSHGRKRKQSPSSQSPFDFTSSSYQQSTIPQLFASASNNSSNSSHQKSCPQPEQPKIKRSRSNSTEFASSGPRDQTTSLTPLTEATMLNFPKSNVIDLTNSPPVAGKSNKGKEPVPARPPSFQPHAGARKLQVKNLRKTTKGDPEAYFNTTWTSLNSALTAIFNGDKISASLEELYRGTENICRGERAGLLFDKLKARMNEYVGGPLKEGIIGRAGRSEDETVKAIEASWSKWNQQLAGSPGMRCQETTLTDSQGMIRSIFLYLDRSFLLPSPSLQSIEATGLALFRAHVASDPVLESKFLRGIFALFEHDRRNEGEIINISLLLSCIRMISNLGMYSQSFEPKFITVSREYFGRVAEQESTSQPLAAYLQNCASQLEKESARCERFHLEISTKREIIAVIEDEMVHKCVPILTDKESVGQLLQARDVKSLKILYSLLDRVGAAGDAIRPAWEAHITTFGSSIVTDEARVEDMVPRLLEFKHALDSMYQGPFRKNDTLGYTLRESFASFINQRRAGQQSANNSKPAEMIAKFVDLLLRTGTKGLPASTTKEMVDLVAAAGDDDAQLAFQLEQVLDLFRFIHGKDVFEAFYKKDLARRLLMGRSASADAERMMITKLKTGKHLHLPLPKYLDC